MFNGPVFTFGCFDLLHDGSVRFLKWAATHGRLVIGLASDQSIHRKYGWSRPLLDHFQRASVLMELRCVDDVYIFDEDSPLSLVKSISPSALAIGPGHPENCEVVEYVLSVGAQVLVAPEFRTSRAGEILSNYLLHNQDKYAIMDS